MATYYVDFVNGLDANNGLGPDASHASNKPWKTLTKLLGAAGMASGDTAYLSPAGPFRETVTAALTSPTVETKVLGDPGNLQGFKTSGGVLVASGPVIHTAYTTNDKTAPSASALMVITGKNFLTFRNIMFVGGGTGTVFNGGAATHDIKIEDCAFIQGGDGDGGSLISTTTTFAVAHNWTLDRCVFEKPGSAGVSALSFTLATGSGADYDANIQVQNCVFTGGNAIAVNVVVTGTAAQHGGGVDVRNCFSDCTGVFMQTAATYVSTSIPCTVNNCFIFSRNSVALNAGTAGQITEDYNIIAATTPRTNVTPGAHSIAAGSYAPLFHFGQESKWGGVYRPFGQPMAGSPLLGFGNDGTQTAYDLDNNPRPAGGASPLPAVGARERGNTWYRGTGTVRTGSNALEITGPGYQDFDIPVDAASTTVTVYVRWDATYAGTKPQMLVRNGEECGVTAATATATGSSGAWEQLSLNFTPTAQGIVTIRVQSNDTNGAGKAFADDFAVA